MLFRSDVIKNLSYDVLRDMGKEATNKVRINVKNESGTTFVYIHNNWIPFNDAINIVQKGNSITTHRHMLNHFGGIIHSPVESEIDRYLSMVEINLKSY